LAKILDGALTLTTDELQGLAGDPEVSEHGLSFVHDKGGEGGPGPERLSRAGRQDSSENAKDDGGQEKKDMTTGFEMLNKMIEDLKTAK
jgi:hypothetical protein